MATNLTKEELKKFLEKYKKQLQDEDYVSLFKALVNDYTYNLSTIASFLYINGINIFKKMTEIPDNMFLNSDISSIEIPNNIKTIGLSAFADCQNLKNIKLNSGLIEVKEKAFMNCPQLTELAFPDSVEKIGRSAVAYCTGLTKAVLPMGPKYLLIADYLFSGDSNLLECNVPGDIQKIGFNAFGNCDKIKINFYKVEGKKPVVTTCDAAFIKKHLNIIKPTGTTTKPTIDTQSPTVDVKDPETTK